MQKNIFLSNKFSYNLYNAIESLPIIDYHCHLSPKEIFEDKEFSNIGEIWLSGDHYKWRLMRTAGIDEKYITGDADFHEKFLKYAEAIEFSAGNPLYHWTHFELSIYFNIDIPLKKSTAEEIWIKANKYIKENHLSPRKLIEKSKVEVICTTDDIIDSLEYHKKIKDDLSFKTTVIPSFRTDNLLLVKKENYLDYLDKLSSISSISISNLKSFKLAVQKRLDYFVSNGCKFTDVGIPFFPNNILKDDETEVVFQKILKKEAISDNEYLGFIGNMYLFLARLYKENNLVMQWHLAVYRNANTKLFKQLGADCGVDTVGTVVKGDNLINMLDAINIECGMPKTIIYTLNPSNSSEIASIAGAFPNVYCGAAWWFCDHKRGIEEQLNIISENSSIGSFLGMLTDSRSFLSYARHDYFRRILCEFIGKMVENNEYDADCAKELVMKISYYNVKELISK